MTSPSLREQVARIIDPSSWRVFDSYLIEMKRHHLHGGYDPDNFVDRASLTKADQILALSALPQPPLSGEQDLESARDHAPTTCAASVASDVIGQPCPDCRTKDGFEHLPGCTEGSGVWLNHRRTLSIDPSVPADHQGEG